MPTGIKTYPTTTAHGILTITNGSVIAQTIPQGFIIAGVATDSAVFVPAGSADGYGVARVSAHALIRGKAGNVAPLAINQVIGSSVYIRNLSPFTGGRDAYSIKVITPQDSQTALDSARASLTTQITRRRDILASPCQESHQEIHTVIVTWVCQFVSSPKLSGMTIIATRLKGSNLFVDVQFVAKPRKIWVK